MAIQTRPWTLEELNRLPDDGNKYELVNGELFVTPAPSEPHEDILVRLTRLITPYVERERLGDILHPRAVVRARGSEVEPDLMVRPKRTSPKKSDWDGAPIPILVVEVMSPTTRRRDLIQKRDFYMSLGVVDYWIVDPDAENVRAVRAEREDVVTTSTLTWQPAGVALPLSISVARLFHDTE